MLELSAKNGSPDWRIGCEAQMTGISLDNVSVEFPLLGTNSRSLRNRLLPSVLGGALNRPREGPPLIHALQSVSMRLSPGDRLAVLGLNGSGKTTLLRVLNRVYIPSSGTASIEGTVGSLIDISIGFNPEATGRENTKLRLSLLGVPRALQGGIVDEVREFTELGDFFEMPLRTYSSGMQMRLAFASATVLQPEIILMDEWLSVGDEGFRKRAENRLREVVEKGEILVLASHSRELVEAMCSTAIWLERGRVREVGPVRDVSQRFFG